MKKLAIGCGVVLLFVCIAIAGGSYYLYRRVAPSIAQFAELSKLPDIEKGIRNRGAFEPPPSAELSEAQIQRLVNVQTDGGAGSEVQVFSREEGCRLR
jgi:hypothetical protein